MNALVIGCGLIGVTTAFALVKRGLTVTVIDREKGPGRGTSFANGGILTPSMADPWNAPGSWRALLASIGRSDSAMQLRLSALPTFAGWGVRFLRNSTPVVFERNTLSNLKLALYSLEAMEALRRDTEVQYGRATRGTLRIFRNRRALDVAVKTATKWSCAGATFRALSVPDVLSLEPGLVPISEGIVGGIHYQGDEAGDAHRFCVGIAQAAEQRGVRFTFNTEARVIRTQSGRVSEVRADGERFIADCYVLAAGPYSSILARSAGVSLPVRPVKGYSVTVGLPPEGPPLRIPVVDDELHAVVTPLSDSIRVAGTAEFAGYDLVLRRARIENLLKLLRTVLPRANLDLSSARPWCGLRPMSADGVPFIGSTSISNLFVNTGHGHLGWTMAAGSAQLVADLIFGDTPKIESKAYSPMRV
jgi:D-amino-acid dehydrogenase